MKRIIAAILISLMLLSMASACTHKPANGGSQATNTAEATQIPTAKPTEASTEAPTEAPTPAPTEDPAAAEAVRMAAEHGLAADDLRGEYALFIRFCEAVEGNEGLDEYGEFVYRIFPVIADNADLVDEEILFSRLSRLSIAVEDLGEDGNAGEFDPSDVSILLDKRTTDRDHYRAPSTLFHELMHFLDYTLAGEMIPIYLLDGRRLTPADTAELSPEDFERKLCCEDTSFVTEGGAELYTCKYYSGTVGSYHKDCGFLTGLEYLYGEDTVRRLFLGWDSDAIFAELLLDAGFSEEEYVSACETLNWFSRPSVYDEPETFFAPEDILIRLYEYKLGGGWKEDARFIYILKCLDGIELPDYLRSEHAEFLSTVLFTTWGKYDRFEKELLACAPEGTSLMIKPPVPFFRGGELYIGSYATITDGETGKDVSGVLIFDFDFDQNKPLSCEFTNTEEVFERYFG